MQDYSKRSGTGIKPRLNRWHGYKLGYWISSQRKMYKEAKSTLTGEQIEKLNKLGMVWNAVDYRWRLAYEQVKAYREQYGNLNIPNSYVNGSGINLHSWLYSQKVNYHSHTLSAGKIALLNALGMDWRFESEKKWDNGFEHAKQYYQKHFNLRLSDNYTTDDGFALGKWLRKQREGRKNLTSEKIKLLNSVGMVWNDKVYSVGQAEGQTKAAAPVPDNSAAKFEAVITG